MTKIISTLLMFAAGMVGAAAQTTSGVEMATGLRSSGKIYVVVLVIVVLFAGLAFYLINIDRKVKKLEDKHQK